MQISSDMNPKDACNPPECQPALPWLLTYADIHPMFRLPALNDLICFGKNTPDF